MELIPYKDNSGQVMGQNERHWEATVREVPGHPSSASFRLHLSTLSLWPGWSVDTCCPIKSGHHRWFEMSQRPANSPSSPWHEKLSCPSSSSCSLWWLKTRCSVCPSMEFVRPWSDSPSTSVGLETPVKRSPKITQWVNGFRLRMAPWPPVQDACLMLFWWEWWRGHTTISKMSSVVVIL